MRKDTLTYKIQSMKVANMREFPAERITSIRTISGMMGFMMNMLYSTRINRKKRTITVMREK